MTNSSHEEKRKYPRTDFDSNVLFQCAGQEYVLMAHNISGGGLRVDSDPDLAPAAEGTVSIPLRPGNAPLACRCRVVYSLEGRGIGIEFLDMSDESRLALKNFVDDAN
jgi:hypothetical protein